MVSCFRWFDKWLLDTWVIDTADRACVLISNTGWLRTLKTWRNLSKKICGGQYSE